MTKERPTSPLISVITVSYNAREELIAVVASVLALKNSEVELIVVDGGSKDGTVEYLQAHTDCIDFWTSEPDRGIYDAMNKAIQHATGSYLLHLNAGDRLLEIPYEELKQGRDAGIEILSFRVALDQGRYFQPSYGFDLVFNNSLHHQGTFFRRDTFPGYQDRYRIFADFDTNQRLALAGARALIYKRVVAYHATDGVSNQNTEEAVAEFFQVISNNYGRKALPVAWMLCKWRGLRTRLERRRLLRLS